MISNIYELYQGTMPIRRVYLDGQMVWTLPTYLPPYLASVDVSTVSDAYLNPFKIVDGYMIDANREYGYGNVVNGPISADAFLINRILTENYYLRNIQSIGNILPAEMVSRIAEEKAYFLSDLYAVVAHGKLFDYDKIHDILSNASEYALSANGRIVNHVDSFGILADPYLQAVSAKGRILDHLTDHSVKIDYLDTAVSANGEVFNYVSDHGIKIDYLDTAISAKGRPLDYLSDHSVKAVYFNSVIGVDGKVSYHLSDHLIDIDYYNSMISAAAKPGTRSGRISVYYNLATSTGSSIAAQHITHDLDENIKTASELIITQGDAGSFNSDASVSITSDHELTLSTMIWLFPQQTDSNLYIPQIYDDGVVVGAVQNGSGLVLQPHTLTN